MSDLSFPSAQPHTIIITGGTGSFGSAFARHLYSVTDCRLRIYSRDEHKQAALAHDLPEGARVSYILGDVRDSQRLRLALDGADTVVHAAALKGVPRSQSEGYEYNLTNVVGSQNVILAARECGLRRALLISTDKAVAPINFYGLTKAIAEGMFIGFNRQCINTPLALACVRGGNIWNSAGSVARVWREALTSGRPLEVYGEATRFHLTMADWVNFVYKSLLEMQAGEIFIPQARGWHLGDLAWSFLQAHNGKGEIKHLPPRAGDKQHETLIPAAEGERAVLLDTGFCVAPPDNLAAAIKYKPRTGKLFGAGREYVSNATSMLVQGELLELAQAVLCSN